MEAPAIVVGVLLMAWFGQGESQANVPCWSVVKHALTNGSVLMILGSLLIGYLATDTQAEGIRPFTTDLFKGFLVLFLLDMGINSGRRLGTFFENGWFATLFAIGVPVLNGCVTAYLSAWVTDVEGERLLFAMLAASASYIAVPATMKWVAPKANPSLYIPMALAVTFPFNITLGMPLYLYLIQ
jgi:uncharacterized protein